jgi:DNA transformation protein and related proteins
LLRRAEANLEAHSFAQAKFIAFMAKMGGLFRRRCPKTPEPPVDPEFISDLFAPFGPVVERRMFGGAGLYREGLMFALVFDGAIFLRVDETSIPDFEREGSRPFVYTRAKSPGKIGRASLSYWRLPERLYDDPEGLAVWAERALEIARRKQAAKRSRTKTKRDAPASKRKPNRRSGA